MRFPMAVSGEVVTLDEVQKIEAERDKALNSLKEIFQHVESWCGKHPISHHEVWQILKVQYEAAAALADAWLKVCHEGNVPQYEEVTSASPAGILHGVRQLASMWSSEKMLREVVERRLQAEIESHKKTAKMCADSNAIEGCVTKKLEKAEARIRDLNERISYLLEH